MPRYIGPYSVVANVGATVKSELPPSSRIHPVFYVSLVKPYKDNGIRQPPTPLIIEGEPYYMVEAIVDHQDISVRGRGGKTRREFLVKWEGYDSRHNTWEPEASLRQSLPLAEAIEDYERKLAIKARHPKPTPISHEALKRPRRTKSDAPGTVRF